MVIIRYLFVLLVGFLAGAATTLWLVQSGAGDFMISRTDVVQDLQRRLREMEQQRDALGRQLDDVVARSGRMENAFTQLERRFRDMVDLVERNTLERGPERGPAERRPGGSGDRDVEAAPSPGEPGPGAREHDGGGAPSHPGAGPREESAPAPSAPGTPPAAAPREPS